RRKSNQSDAHEMPNTCIHACVRSAYFSHPVMLSSFERHLVELHDDTQAHIPNRLVDNTKKNDFAWSVQHNGSAPGAQEQAHDEQYCA
ncbi:MAG: hypothetical protein AAFP00_18605, partial [Bacteroidota bacterium]